MTGQTSIPDDYSWASYGALTGWRVPNCAKQSQFAEAEMVGKSFYEKGLGVSLSNRAVEKQTQFQGAGCERVSGRCGYPDVQLLAIDRSGAAYTMGVGDRIGSFLGDL
ncbi:MAG: hypothetical protein ACYTAS_23235 [Planctomycetota bacterium]|jgi:hypothetical protein